MKKTNLVIVASIIILVLIITTSATEFFNLKEDKYIEIGFASSLSGDAGIWGQDIKTGFDFAVNQLNSKGGIDGKLIKPVYEDDECDPKIGVIAYNKLIEIDKVKIITGTMCSSVAMAVTDQTQNNRVLYMATGATHPDVAKLGDLVFRIYPSDTFEIEKIIEYMVLEKNITKFGLINLSDQALGLSARDTIKKATSRNNAEITKEETYTLTDKDFKTIISKVMYTNPEAIYVISIPEQTPLIFNQIKELGYKGIIIGYSGALNISEVTDQIKDKTNIYYPEPVIIQQTSFWEDYKQATGEKASYIMGVGYDTFKIIEDGLKVCGEDNDCIRDYWLTLKDYPTSRGNISYDEDGDITNVEYAVKELS